MASQETFDFVPDQPARVRPDGRRAAFEVYHRDCPEVYRELRRRALAYKRAHQEVSLRTLFDELRTEARNDSAAWWTRTKRFRLNGNYQSFYRDLLNASPGLSEYFEVRR